jgi:hypothetical protein
MPNEPSQDCVNRLTEIVAREGIATVTLALSRIAADIHERNRAAAERHLLASIHSIRVEQASR